MMLKVAEAITGRICLLLLEKCNAVSRALHKAKRLICGRMLATCILDTLLGKTGLRKSTDWKIEIADQEAHVMYAYICVQRWSTGWLKPYGALLLYTLGTVKNGTKL